MSTFTIPTTRQRPLVAFDKTIANIENEATYDQVCRNYVTSGIGTANRWLYAIDTFKLLDRQPYICWELVWPVNQSHLIYRFVAYASTHHGTMDHSKQHTLVMEMIHQEPAPNLTHFFQHIRTHEIPCQRLAGNPV